MTALFRPLGLIKDMLTSLGLELTYAYEDLVFVQHNAFLLQFEDATETVAMHINVECPPDQVDGLAESVIAAGAKVDLRVVMRGRYAIAANEEEETFSVRFV